MYTQTNTFALTLRSKLELPVHLICICLDCGNWSALRLQPAGGFKLLIVCAEMQILLFCFALLNNACRRLCSLDGGVRLFRGFFVICRFKNVSTRS